MKPTSREILKNLSRDETYPSRDEKNLSGDFFTFTPTNQFFTHPNYLIRSIMTILTLNLIP
ncbi:MAG: hypothetical protein LBU34_03090, partial [Planctomycetaceae bacterium]|nr:hypothetical protein [Planctomycetaceae bacterium]